MEISDALALARDNHQSTLVTIRRNGRPQLSNVLHSVDDDGVLLISTSADRAKCRNAVRDPWVALHLNGSSFWSYVVIEGQASVTPVAADPHDDTVEALVELYRSLAGEHDDWDDYRAAMVAERRVVLSIRPDRAYGLIR